jgi:hypothetical protein
MKRVLHGLLKSPYLQLLQAGERLRYRHLWARQLTFAEANRKVAELLVQGDPCLVARIGHTEGRIVGEALFRGGHFSKLTNKQAHQNAGIFPVTPDLLMKFASVYADSIAQADLLGFWQTSFQARLLSQRFSRVPLAPLSALEPYLHPMPWSAALAGLRVLVVHPFAASIEHQYKYKRSLLFVDPLVLPEFELQALLPPQTIAPLTGGHESWCFALDRLVETVLRQDFDVALLGCGAYGLPLGAAIKAMGKQAIHLGGSLQVLFGIRGRRWEKIPVMAAMMNEHWIRASKAETPVSASCVEEGCYW